MRNDIYWTCSIIRLQRFIHVSSKEIFSWDRSRCSVSIWRSPSNSIRMVNERLTNLFDSIEILWSAVPIDYFYFHISIIIEEWILIDYSYDEKFDQIKTIDLSNRNWNLSSKKNPFFFQIKDVQFRFVFFFFFAQTDSSVNHRCLKFSTSSFFWSHFNDWFSS